MKKFLILFFLPLNFIFAESVTLYNDTPFELIAQVLSASGRVIAQKTLAPSEQSVWDTNQIETELNIKYNVSSSYTPFTVIWKCSYEGVFSINYNVASGAMAVASQGTGGDHYCKPKPKKEEKQ